MMAIGPWRNVPRPADAVGAEGAWHMAEEASKQHPQAVRALWDGDQVLALGGVVQWAPAEGYAFLWVPAALSRSAWRRGWTTLSAMLQWAHQRGLRTISCVVQADHLQGHRLARRLGFEPLGPAPLFAGCGKPMLRYFRCWPSFDEPALVRHQRYELWRACLGAWCPAYLAEIGA